MAPAASTSSSWQALYCQYIICGGDRRRRLRMWREKKGISRVLEDNWLVHSLIDSLRLRESIGIYNTHMGYLTWGFPAQQPRLAGLITTHTWPIPRSWQPDGLSAREQSACSYSTKVPTASPIAWPSCLARSMMACSHTTVTSTCKPTGPCNMHVYVHLSVSTRNTGCKK